MNRQLRQIMLFTVLLAVLGACASVGNVGSVATPQWSNQAQPSHFALTVSDDSYIDGGSASGYELSVEEFDKDVVVSINAQDAQQLKALFVELEFDPEQYRPLHAGPTDSMGDPDNMLTITHLKERGSVHYGQVVANFEWRTGMSGSGTVARIQLRKEPTPVLRGVSTPPTHADSKALLAFDEGTNTLTWDYSNRGDYDQNREVNAADLVPIAANFLHTSGGGSFPRTSHFSVIDGDGNGEINAADIVPIAGSFLNVVASYNVYCSTNAADYPAAPGDPSTATPIDNVLFTEAIEAPDSRKTFSLVITPEVGGSYWVRPVDAGGAEGTPSNRAAAGDVAPNLLFDQDGSVTGDGLTALTAYQISTETLYSFTVLDPQTGNSDVTAQSTLIVSNAQVIVTDETINVPASQTGSFTVEAEFNGFLSDTLHFTIAGSGGGDLNILPDPADDDWNHAEVSGDGSSDMPFILHTDTFNTTVDPDGNFSIEFSLVAEDGATPPNPIDVTTLTWFAVPPFIAPDIDDAPEGTFRVNQFTNGRVYAQDDSMTQSNQIWVASQGLPD